MRRLDNALDPSSGFDRLTLMTDAIAKAAELWAFLRQSGITTASPDALDAEAILAGQVVLAGSVINQRSSLFRQEPDRPTDHSSCRRRCEDT